MKFGTNLFTNSSHVLFPQHTLLWMKLTWAKLWSSACWLVQWMKQPLTTIKSQSSKWNATKEQNLRDNQQTYKCWELQTEKKVKLFDYTYNCNCVCTCLKINATEFIKIPESLYLLQYHQFYCLKWNKNVPNDRYFSDP